MKKRKKIVVQGAYGDGNFGDDFLLLMVLKLLFRKGFNAEEILITGNRGADFLKMLDKKIRIVSHSIGKYIGADYFLLGGGTQFFSFRQSSLNSRRVFSYLRILYNDPLVIFYFIKKKLGIIQEPEKIALAIGLGPFVDENVEQSTIRDLSAYSKIYCRDKRSKAYCEEWKIDSILAADLCLSDLFQSDFSLNHSTAIVARKTIGIILRDWIQNDDGNSINDKIFAILQELEIYDIKFFVFSKTKDFDLIKRIKKQNLVPIEDVHIWDPNNYSFIQYLELINLCDAIITSRYHGGIFALNYRIPTICLAIDPKLKFLVEEVEGFTYCEIENIGNISHMVDEIFDNYERKQECLENSYNKLNSRANLILNLSFEK